MGTKGNRFWEARSSHGRKPVFEDADALWSAAVEYFDWVEDNPLDADLRFSSNPRPRAMTLEGLRIFIGISTSTWYNYCEKKDFLEVTEAIGEIIRTQKFEGASAGYFNANIIARDLGLKEQTENDTRHSFDFSNLDDGELERIARGEEN